MTDRNAKKEQFNDNNGGKGKRLILGAVTLVLVAGAALAGGTFFGQRADDYPDVRAESGEVRIPVSQIDDGKAHFFSYQAGGNTVRFFVLQSGDGVIRAAFDACDVCFREQRGYSQAGDAMVCNNCGQKFVSERINEVKGGCNPAPINRRVQNGHVVIAAADLARGSGYFVSAK
jgi:uncharacterized membrane protein